MRGTTHPSCVYSLGKASSVASGKFNMSRQCSRESRLTSFCQSKQVESRIAAQHWQRNLWFKHARASNDHGVKIYRSSTKRHVTDMLRSTGMTNYNQVCFALAFGNHGHLVAEGRRIVTVYHSWTLLVCCRASYLNGVW